MNQISKSILLLSVIAGSMLSSYADRGVRRKSTNKVVLNVSNKTTFRNSISSNLVTGMKCTGALIVNDQTENNFITGTVINTYQKGNTVYLVPNKQKTIVPEIKQSYAGMKLVVKS